MPTVTPKLKIKPLDIVDDDSSLGSPPSKTKSERRHSSVSDKAKHEEAFQKGRKGKRDISFSFV